MATKKNTKKNVAATAKPVSEQPDTALHNGKQVVGQPSDVARFTIGDLVQMHLFFKNELFDEAPHGDIGTVHSLSYEDETHFYHMPVVLFPHGLCMCNPDFLIVSQYLVPRNGENGETERLELAAKQIEEAAAKKTAAPPAE